MTAFLLASARACYALVVIVTTGFSAYFAFLFLKALIPTFAALAITLAAAAFLILGVGALRRKLRGHPLIPRPSNYREWLYISLMTVFGSLGHFLAGNVCLAIYQYLYVYPDRDREGGPLAGIAIVASFCYLVALLLVEFGIRHEKAAQPRISPSSGFAEPLPGNTLNSSAADETPR